jgi:phosphatidate cytidylyltransferase
VTRVASGAVLLLLAVGIVWFAPPLLFVAVAELLLVGAFVEYAKLARARGLALPLLPSGTAAAVTAAAFAGATPAGALDDVLMSALIALGSLTIARWRPSTNSGRPGPAEGRPATAEGRGGDALALAAAAAFPALYLGLPIGGMIAIRESRGPEGLFLLMLTVIISDTAQYYTGRAFGRRRLAEQISPKKTVEGAIGGFVFGGVFLAAAGAWWLPEVPVALRAALGVTIVALGICGDLFESMLKRSAGVKDSSALIPGHGGVLDRIDALLFAAPVYYIVLKYL